MEPFPFIVGAGRSGNTLLRLMLDAHPDLAIPPETDFLPEAMSITNPLEFFNFVTSHWRWTDCHVDQKLFLDQIKQLKNFNATSGIRIFYQLYTARFGKKRFGDKSPSYLSHMTTIQNFLPEAHFIHIIRDGRDVALSIRPLWFGPNTIEEIAHWWVHLLEVARIQSEKIKNYLEIRYEDLLLKTEPVLRKICEFIKLDWHPALLNFHQRAESRIQEVVSDFQIADGKCIPVSARHTIHSLTKKPPQINRIGNWRKELTLNEQKIFHTIAGKTLQKYGYA
jgi:hypothetical protein